MTEICCTCLSRDRALVSLDKDKYGTLFGKKSILMFVQNVCWECAAMFQKVLRFKEQVATAQDYLQRANHQIYNLTPLTCLRYSTPTLNDICCDHNFDSLENTYYPVKTDVQIKSEELIMDDLIKSFDTEESNEKIESLDVDVIQIKHENDLSNDEMIEDIIITNLEVKPFKTCKVERKNVHAKVNKKVKQVSVTKDNYIVIEMTEEEMLSKRETDKQADRYKNKVKYRCELCISGFFHEELYEKHIRIRHSENAGPHQCPICQTRFNNTNAHREHIAEHYRKYKCKECSYIGYSLTEMVAHDAKEHEVKRFTCKICHEEFPLRSRLRFHRETTHEAPVKCESCGKMFRTKDSLRVHIKQMHTYLPKASCPTCGVRVRNLKSHSRTHQAAPEAAYCAECDQRFTSTASYRSHLKYAARHRAPDTVSHVCNACDARFATRAGLKKHQLRRHTAVRAHKCEQCGKGFEELCKLKLHILHGHEGVEKPRDKICHICGRGFTTKLTLSNHIRVHTGEKPFRCEVCGAAFSQKSSLTTHTRGVHLKIRPRPGRPQRA